MFFLIYFEFINPLKSYKIMRKTNSLKGGIFNTILLSVLTLQSISVSSQICSCSTSVSGWSNQKAFVIDNSINPSALVNYQVLIDLNTTTLIGAGDMNANGSDIRVSGLCDNSNPLDFWFDDINTANTKVWVKIPTIAANSTDTIYLHYGNPTAISTANGANVFSFFEDFESPLTGWTFSGGTWSTTTFLGENTMTCTDLTEGNGYAALLSTTLGMSDYIVEVEYATSADGAMGGPFFEHDDFSNYNGYHLMTGADLTMITTITGGSPDYSQSQAFVSVPNQWYDWKIVRNGTSSSIDIYLDGLLQNSNSTIFTDGVGLWSYSGTSTDNVYYDNLFVREFSAIEPTVNELTLSDIIAPVADIATLTDVTDQCSVASITAPTATDNCAGSVTGTTTTTFPITTQGTTTITWNYDDGNGNSSTQTQNVVLTDVLAPVVDIATLTDATDQCSVASITAPTATDNCVGSVTGTTTTTFPITTQGTTTITWNYDDGNGNSSTQTQNVVLTDVLAPMADIATLTDVTDQCSVASITAPTATDNCAGSVTGTTTTTFPITTQGTTTITWNYDDGNGNSSTQTQNVVLTDVLAPVADIATLTDATDQCSVASITAPTATDNCAGSVTGTTTTTFPITTQGTTTITWNYDDGNGNSSTQTQNVVLTDVLAPVAICQNITVLSDGTGNATMVAADIDGGSTDNCVTLTFSASQTAFTCADLGPKNVTLTVTDGNSNASTCVAVVTVLDLILPSISCPNNIIACADDIILFSTPSSVDNCSATVTQTDATGLSSGMVFPVGTTTIEFTSTDASGNTAVCSFNVDVSSIDNTITNSASTLTANQNGATYKWIDCDNGNSYISGETNQSYTVTTTGNYAVEVTMGNCIEASTCENVIISGIEKQYALNDISIYPNPTNSAFTINVSSLKEGTIITVYNSVGQEIIRQPLINKETIFDLSNQNKGIYFIKLQNGDVITTKRILKQ